MRSPERRPGGYKSPRNVATCCRSGLKRTHHGQNITSHTVPQGARHQKKRRGHLLSRFPRRNGDTKKDNKNFQRHPRSRGIHEAGAIVINEWRPKGWLAQALPRQEQRPQGQAARLRHLRALSRGFHPRLLIQAMTLDLHCLYALDEMAEAAIDIAEALSAGKKPELRQMRRYAKAKLGVASAGTSRKTSTSRLKNFYSGTKHLWPKGR